MLILFGTRQYGQTDRVPGYFCVTTTFFHINFVPLIPVESNVLIDGTDHGWSTYFSFKSWLVAWSRAFLLVGGVAATAIGALGTVAGAWPAILAALLGIGMLVAFYYSYSLPWVGMATAERALEMAEEAGLDMEDVLAIKVMYGLLTPAQANSELEAYERTLTQEPIYSESPLGNPEQLPYVDPQRSGAPPRLGA